MVGGTVGQIWADPDINRLAGQLVVDAGGTAVRTATRVIQAVNHSVVLSTRVANRTCSTMTPLDSF